MRRVLVVCTVHNETGNATAGELHWLLGHLRPEVIFLEHSSTNFSTFLDGSCRTLESAAVMHYRKRNVVELVPVERKRVRVTTSWSWRTANTPRWEGWHTSIAQPAPCSRQK